MNYLMSDIHGDFANFYKMLEKIKFSSKDKLYILGDIFDKGKENIRLYRFICHADNIFLIKGNHEYLCERYLSHIVTGEFWDRCGGHRTRKEVERLEEDEKLALYKFIQSLPIYTIIETDDKKYFMTHSGYHADFCVRNPNSGLVDIKSSVRQAVHHNQERYLFSEDIHYVPSALKFDHKIIVGHHPTLLLPQYHRASIYHGKNYIDIDTGNERRSQGGRLACLRIDDGREFYV